MADQYTIISGTNRKHSNTLKIANQYRDLLLEKEIAAQLLSLEGWSFLERTAAFEQLERDILISATKFIIVSPEYNGSIPGVLKVMLDISDYKAVWKGKKALLTGVSTGRAGNLRGMDHLTGILNYMQVIVHPNKLPISAVDRLFNGLDRLYDQDVVKAINGQLNEFIAF